MQFADVGGDGAGKHAVPSWAAGAQLFADLSGRDGDGDRIHEVNGNTAEMQSADAASSARGAADDGARAQRGRQVVGDLRQRISRAADHNELASAQQFFRLAPLGDFCEGINADEKKQAVIFFKLALEARMVSME